MIKLTEEQRQKSEYILQLRDSWKFEEDFSIPKDFEDHYQWHSLAMYFIAINWYRFENISDPEYWDGDKFKEDVFFNDCYLGELENIPEVEWDLNNMLIEEILSFIQDYYHGHGDYSISDFWHDQRLYHEFLNLEEK